MTTPESPTVETWFDNCGGWSPALDLGVLQRGIAAGMLNLQDEFGMTALSLAVMSNWNEGVEELLRQGADTEIRYFRTGATALYMATLERKEAIIAALIAAGANPDAPNYWGITPRLWSSRTGDTYFEQIPVRESTQPPTRIQNAECRTPRGSLFTVQDSQSKRTRRAASWAGS